jgi:nucleoside-diphosphate-sugar epimerase
MAGCDVVFHAAAKVHDWGPKAEFQRDTIDGTRKVLEAARAAGVRRVVHVSTEAVLVGKGAPKIHGADESVPLPARPLGMYPWSKGRAEELVRAANGSGLETVIVRPRFIWGKGDTVLLPRLAEMVRAGKFVWIGGGHFPTSTVHVQNVCHGLLLAAERGVPGETYFVTDGDPIEMREFLSAMLGAAGVDVSRVRSLPRWAAAVGAWLGEAVWTVGRLRGVPPVTRTGVRLVGEEVTVSDAKARRELGYAPVVTREAGLAELRA